jgi:gluconolactonase
MRTGPDRGPGLARRALAGLGALLLVGLSASAQTLEVVATITPASETECGPCLEGPAVDAAGTVYFTDLPRNRILRLGTDGRVSTYREPANNPNGLVFDRQFRLIAAERGDAAAKTPGRITRTDMKTGRIEVIAETYHGASFGTPNDVTFDGRGRIFFSAGGNVYRIDEDGTVAQVVAAPVVDSSNGVILSPDDRRLYVVEMNRGPKGPRRVRVFDLSPEGVAANPRVFHEFFPGRGGDGMAIDVDGNLYVAAGMNKPRGTTETLDVKAGVYVFSPAGALVRQIPVPLDIITNVAFGGPDLKTLYITSGTTLYRVANGVAGTRR